MTDARVQVVTVAPEPANVAGRDVRPSEQVLLLARRQALLLELSAIEDYLGMPKSVVTQASLRDRIPRCVSGVIESYLRIALTPAQRDELRERIAASIRG